MTKTTRKFCCLALAALLAFSAAPAGAAHAAGVERGRQLLPERASREQAEQQRRQQAEQIRRQQLGDLRDIWLNIGNSNELSMIYALLQSFLHYRC